MNIAEVLGTAVSDQAELEVTHSSQCGTPAVDIAGSAPVEQTRYRTVVVAVAAALLIGVAGGWYVASTSATGPIAPAALAAPVALPADVAGTAEMFTSLYLTGAASAADLAVLYAGDTPATTATWVNSSRTISAEMVEEGLWNVTVLVDSLEAVDGKYEHVGLRYFLIPVSTASGRPIAIAAPAQIPPPSPAPPSNHFTASVPADQANAAATFIEEYVTGGTDVARYLSATARVPLFAAAPYVSAVTTPRGADEQGRVAVAVAATNERGITHHLEYTLTLTFADGVWEVADMSDGME